MSLKNNAIVAAMTAVLAERFPACFQVFERRRRPLKIGIHEDITAATPDLDPRHVRLALAAYARNPWYLRAIVTGASRVGLDGGAAGIITADQATHAAEKLADLNRQKRARTTPEIFGAPGDGDDRGTIAAHRCIDADPDRQISLDHDGA